MEEPPVKTKKTREERATYRLEVEAEKTKEGPTVSNKTPLPVAHDVRKPNTYVFSVFPFFFSISDHHVSTY
jgi:hypothetical protein